MQEVVPIAVSAAVRTDIASWMIVFQNSLFFIILKVKVVLSVLLTPLPPMQEVNPEGGRGYSQRHALIANCPLNIEVIACAIVATVS